MTEATRLSGVVRKIKVGYAFVSGNDGTDYFLHWTSLKKDSKTFRELTVGDRLTFDRYDAPKGPRAVEVSVVS